MHKFKHPEDLLPEEFWNFSEANCCENVDGYFSKSSQSLTGTWPPITQDMKEISNNWITFPWGEGERRQWSIPASVKTVWGPPILVQCCAGSSLALDTRQEVLCSLNITLLSVCAPPPKSATPPKLVLWWDPNRRLSKLWISCGILNVPQRSTGWRFHHQLAVPLENSGTCMRWGLVTGKKVIRTCLWIGHWDSGFLFSLLPGNHWWTTTPQPQRQWANAYGLKPPKL